MHGLKLTTFALVLLFSAVLVFAQDMTSQSRTYNTSGITKVQEGPGFTGHSDGISLYPADLDRQYKNAVESGNMAEANRLQALIESYVPAENLSKGTSDDGPVFRTIKNPDPPFTPDWYTADVLVWSGAMSGPPGFRRMALEMGEDYNLYLAFVTPQISSTSHVYIYRSSTMGATWTQIGDIFYSSGYFGQIDMIAEMRSASVEDSTRLIVYYTYATNSSLDGASLGMFSCLRTGAAGYYVNGIIAPASGNRLSYPTACSDGAYYSTATYFGVVVSEENNSTGVVANLSYAKSNNWGPTHTTVSWATSYDDRYPSSAHHHGTTDSIWVAVERHFSATNYLVRVIASPWTSNSGFNTFFVPPTGSDMYEKPSMTILQKQGGPRADSVLISVLKNDMSVYHFSADGGINWTTDASGGALGNNKLFTYSSSTWLANNPSKFTMIFGDNGGDSIVLRRGYLNYMSSGTIQYKRNTNSFSTSMAPVCVTAVNGTTPYAAVGYPGFGPTNIYANSETIFTGINENGTGIPVTYLLAQNYPNPFNPTTRILFDIPKAGLVNITVYDILGREIAVIVNEQMNAGSYTAEFDASNVSSGIYFYRMQADGFIATKKMMVIK